MEQTRRVVRDLPLPDPLRRELLDYLLATSLERAGIIARLSEQNPSVADLLMDLEADDELRARFEIELMRPDNFHRQGR